MKIRHKLITVIPIIITTTVIVLLWDARAVRAFKNPRRNIFSFPASLHLQITT